MKAIPLLVICWVTLAATSLLYLNFLSSLISVMFIILHEKTDLLIEIPLLSSVEALALIWSELLYSDIPAT